MDEKNGHKAPVATYPDGITVPWQQCPACGCTETFFDHVTAGELTLDGPKVVRLFLLPMTYQTALQTKQMIAMVDICPKCGTVYCRGFSKVAMQNKKMRPGGLGLMRVK